jgi:hypothetical protein
MLRRVWITAATTLCASVPFASPDNDHFIGVPEDVVSAARTACGSKWREYHALHDDDAGRMFAIARALAENPPPPPAKR